MLNKTELQNLRNDIILNSLYYNDYKNRYNIDKYIVCDFFDAYTEWLQLEFETDYNNMNYYDFMEKYDNIDNLYYFYEYETSEFFFLNMVI